MHAGALKRIRELLRDTGARIMTGAQPTAKRDRSKAHEQAVAA